MVLSSAYLPNANRTNVSNYGDGGLSGGGPPVSSESYANSTNRILFDGNYYYNYDPAGNRTAKFNSTTGALDSTATNITIYAWDNANELVSVKTFDTYAHYTDYLSGGWAAVDADSGGTGGGDSGGSDSGGSGGSGVTSTPIAEGEVDYAYAADGLMVSRNTLDASGDSTSGEFYINDGVQMALVLNAAGQVTERELYGPAVDQVMASEYVTPVSGGGPQSAGTTSFMLPDFQGSVRDVLQASVYTSGGATVVNATEVDHLDYDAFGSLLNQTNASAQPRYTYTGRQYDAATGLYYYRARWYDPVTGAWICNDPLGFNAGQTNLQEYVANDPVNYVDPSGMDLSDWNPVNIAGNLAGAGAQYAWNSIDNNTVVTDEHARNSSILHLGNQYGAGYGDASRRRLVLLPGVGHMEGGTPSGGGTPVRPHWVGPPPRFRMEGPPQPDEVFSAVTKGVINAALVLLPMTDGIASFAEAGLGESRVLVDEAAEVAEESDAATSEVSEAEQAICDGTHCFPAGTLVATMEGNVPIEAIRRGNRVWSFDLVTGNWRPCCVLQTFINDYNENATFITVAGETIHSTSGHPFWLVQGEQMASRRCPAHAVAPKGATTVGRWVQASDLRAGDDLLLRDGRMVRVEAVRHEQFVGKVYNFSVAELESYAVGLNNVLVHNTPSVPGIPGSCFGEGDGHFIDSWSLVDENQNLIADSGDDGVWSGLERSLDDGEQLSWTEQAEQTHTEGIIISENEALFSPGSTLEMSGYKNPCQACQNLMIQKSSQYQMNIMYTNQDWDIWACTNGE